MRLCAIASGSSGNCIYIGSETTHLLVDAGISAKKIEAGLESIGVKPDQISAILITHEHSDHIQGIGVLARRHHIPLYGTVETISALLRLKTCGKIEENLLNFVKPDVKFTLGDFTVEPYTISHDASNPVCYTFETDKGKIGFATDLGTYTEYTVKKLSGCKLLYMEANHDVNMLMVGGYPYYLKQRIAGDFGHLSNETSAKLICELLNDGLQEIVLGHLSKENNYAELAYETVRCEVIKKYEDKEKMPKICVASRDCVSDVITVL